MVLFKCQKCGKNFQGTKRQIWMNYSMHVHTSHPLEEKELIVQCEKRLGISEKEKTIPFWEPGGPQKFWAICPQCVYRWKTISPPLRKRNYVKCPKCKLKGNWQEFYAFKGKFNL